jgi:putative transposase
LYSNRRHGRSGHVFEQRYKALLVDKDNYLLQVSRYIHRNPVEAKLVGRPQDYRWSSYGAYGTAKAVRGLTTSLVLEQLGGKRREQTRRTVQQLQSQSQILRLAIWNSIESDHEADHAVFLKTIREKSIQNNTILPFLG